MYYNKSLYHPHTFEGRRIDTAYRISSTDFIVGFINEVRFNKGTQLDWLEDSRIRSEWEANTLLEWINNPDFKKTNNSLLNIQGTHDYRQQMAYIPSNFGRGKGYIFYFICNGCERRVKYLYMLKNSSIFRCRECNKLRYPLIISDVEPGNKKLSLQELDS